LALVKNADFKSDEDVAAFSLRLQALARAAAAQGGQVLRGGGGRKGEKQEGGGPAAAERGSSAEDTQPSVEDVRKRQADIIATLASSGLIEEKHAEALTALLDEDADRVQAIFDRAVEDDGDIDKLAERLTVLARGLVGERAQKAQEEAKEAARESEAQPRRSRSVDSGFGEFARGTPEQERLLQLYRARRLADPEAFLLWKLLLAKDAVVLAALGELAGGENDGAALDEAADTLKRRLAVQPLPRPGQRPDPLQNYALLFLDTLEQMREEKQASEEECDVLWALLLKEDDALREAFEALNMEANTDEFRELLQEVTAVRVQEDLEALLREAPRTASDDA
jgi:hypothetical protein